MKILRRWLMYFLVIAPASSPIFAGEAKSPFSEWEKTVEAAKKEGKLVAAIPASAELRKAITERFSQALSRYRARTHQRARAVQRRQDRRRTRRRRALLRPLDQRHVNAV